MKLPPASVASHLRPSRLVAAAVAATSLMAVVPAAAASVSTSTAGIAQATADDGLRGIDVSRWQHGGDLDWAAVRGDGYSFAFVKATESDDYVNSYYRSDRRQAKRTGLYVGAYHYARPGSATARTQARWFAAEVGTLDAAGDLPPVLDLEDTGGLGVTELRIWVRRWLRTVEKLTGRAPLIYASPYFWTTHLGDTAQFTGYRLWIANYRVTEPTVPGGWPRWTFWQQSNEGRVAGISGDVDIDAFNGGSKRLARLANDGAMLDPLRQRATVTSLALSRTSVSAGRNVEFSGTLTAARSGQTLAGMPVQVQQRVAGAWQTVARTKTFPAGGYQVDVTPAASATYRAVYPGVATSAYTESVSVTASVTVG